MIKSYKDLIVWQKSITLVTEIYIVTKTFPKAEIYGLISQMQRSAVSIPSNIAEGYGRHATKDYIRFLRIALGSLYELQTQLEICKNLNYISSQNYENILNMSNEIGKMLNSLITKLT
jgi:four helix bundle protein